MTVKDLFVHELPLGIIMPFLSECTTETNPRLLDIVACDSIDPRFHDMEVADFSEEVDIFGDTYLEVWIL